MNLRKLFVFCAAFLMVASLGLTQAQDYGRFIGTVFSTEGTPLPGVAVTAKNTLMGLSQATVTNDLVDRALEPLRANLLTTRIARREILNRVQTEDQPRDVTAGAKHSRAAKDYQQLTEEILTLWPSP